MELKYPTHSRFSEPLRRALRKGAGEMQWPIRVDLGPGGYKRDAQVEIRADNPSSFETDWESEHPSRFSVRVRAAAAVLQSEGYHGRFRITHANGTLTVRRI